VPDATVRLRDLCGSARFPTLGLPISLAVKGPRQATYASLLGQARRVGDKLSEGSGLADLMISRAFDPAREVRVELDALAIKAKGASWDDAFEALNRQGIQWLVPTFVITPGTIAEGGFHVSRERGPWPIASRIPDTVTYDRAVEQFRNQLNEATVKGAGGSAVALTELIRTHERSGPPILERIDGRLAVEITANLAPGAALSEVRAACRRLASQARLDPGFEINWQE
jgi:multidrug efflux pump subunit AcrB